MRYQKIVALALVLGLGIVCGDEVKLNNGAIIVGKVKQAFGGKVEVATDYMGDVSIAAEKVISIVTDESVHTAVGEKRTTGKLEAGTALDYKNLALWREGAEDPTAPKGRKWKYQAAGSIAGKTGNTEKTNLMGGFNATLQGPVDKLMLYTRASYGRENGSENDRDLLFGGDYERRIFESRHSWYARSEYEYDKFNDMDPQVVTALGYGYYAIDRDELRMRFRLGLNYTYRDYISDHDKDSSIALDANYHHEIKMDKLFKLENFGTLVTDVTYTPLFKEFSNYRVYHESALTLPLGGSKFWSIRLGVSNDYHSVISSDKQRLNTTYFAKLVLDWE